MIITLKGADASSLGLGQIEMPIEIQEETLAILAKTSRYTQGSEQTMFLNRFIYDLKQEGIYTKIGMFIPTFMCNSLQEAAYDAISDSYLTWLNPGTYNQTNHTIAGTSTAYASGINLTKQALGNFHFNSSASYVWRYSPTGSSTSKSWFLYIDNRNSNITILPICAKNANPQNTSNRFYKEVSNKKGVFALNLVGTNLPSDGTKVYDSQSDTIETLTATSVVEVTNLSTLELQPQYLGIGGYNDTPVSVKSEFHILGNNQNLTDEEFLTFSRLCIRLYDSLQSL